MRSGVQPRTSPWPNRSTFVLLPALLWAIGFAEVAQGQISYQVLHSFVLPPIDAAGPLLQASDGNFYGTSSKGGAFDKGTIFRFTASGTLTTLYSFTGPDGASPAAGLIQATDGYFYGTTIEGGAFNQGTIFQLTPSGILTTLHSFSRGSDGYWPSGGLIQGTDGNFYGTTPYGGPSYCSCGTIFRLTPSGIFTILHSFSGPDGSSPYGALIQASDGNLYGTTSRGGPLYGSGGYGTIFQITPNGILTTLYSFSGPDGWSPEAGLLQGTDGNFYGTTSSGGASSKGTIFQVTPGGVLTTLHSFTGPDGARPTAALIQATDGNFYGTTSSGGSSSYYGTVFQLTPGGVLTTLHSFTGGSGDAGPGSALIQRTDGNLYGTNPGTVFKLSTGGAFTTFVVLTSSEGSNPTAGLIQATDGNFYGTTSAGGTSNKGTIFQLTPTGVLTTLHSFTGPDGAIPLAPLIQATDGNFYGTTSMGGASDKGTVFRLTPSGVLTTLHSFTGPDSERPYGGLIQAADGNFYGTTYGIPYIVTSSDYGTVFRLTPSGVLTTLHSFDGKGEGAHPQAGLIQASDGNFYGTTSSSGGGLYYGAVFRLTPSGVLTVLHTFLLDGDVPIGGLIQGGDGALYGTTYCVGLICGIVYKVTLDGVFTTLHEFALSEGSSSTGLIQASDGNFYGTGYQYFSQENSGTVFRMTPNGSVATVHTFSGPDGANPAATLIQGSDGSLYGTTKAGGPNGGGVVFSLTLQGTLFPLNVSFAEAGGSGTVASSDSGISCETSCNALYASGTTVTLSATPATGSIFTGWSGACSGTGPCIVSISSEASVTATFALQAFPLTVTLTGTGSGTVTSSPTGIACEPTCSQSFSYGTSVWLTGTAASGSILAGWSEAGCSGTLTCRVSLTQSQSVTAKFNIIPPPETTIVTGPTGTIADNGVMFSWTGSDDATPVWNLVYASRLDPLEPTFSYFGSQRSRTYTYLANGSYTFYVKARNGSGVEDPTPASRSFTVSAPSGYDPLVGQQWHLKSRGYEPAGADARAAWATTQGAGVVIGIVDDGLQYTHPDLQPNYVADLSWDFNGNDPDPAPSTSGSCDTTADCHGTAVAGLAAARGDNGIGGSGVAPFASLAGLRLIAAPISDAEMAAALGHQPDAIHISNNSWGFIGDLADLGPLAHAAMETAVAQGRAGRGRIFVVAAGNLGEYSDNCNFDGFDNSRFVIAVGALSKVGWRQADYSEPCSALFVMAPSSDDFYGQGGITTTDLIGAPGYDPGDYTSIFGGTSAAAPMVSGVVALMLAENPSLTWRDVKHILARTAVRIDTDVSGWTKGPFAHNEKFGFGLVDGQAAVSLAASWTNVAAESAIPAVTHTISQVVPDNNATGLMDSIVINNSYSDFHVEHVEVVFDATHPHRGDLEVTLTSPAGVTSHLATPRGLDSGQDFSAWRFGSVRHWGESADGTWTLRVMDQTAGNVGTWNSWTLRIFGTAGSTPDTLTITTPANGSSNPVNSGETANLNVTASDSLGHPLSYAWTASCPNLPGAGDFSNPTAQNPTWTAPVNTTGSQQSCTLQVTVSDGHGLTQVSSYWEAVGPQPDTTPPVTIITSDPSGTITGNSASFTWAGSDDVTPAGSLVYAYRLDPLEPTFSAFTSANSKTYTYLANGFYIFYVKAKDLVGNEDLTPARRSFTLASTHSLTVTRLGTGIGRITSSPAGIDCGVTCSTTYDPGSSVILTATAASGSVFTGWSGEGCMGTGTCTITMTQARNVAAAFHNPDKIGIVRDGIWYLDDNGNGAWDGCGTDYCLSWGGEAEDKHVLGDWNGDGKTKIGIYRAGTWYLDANGNGAWDGCGTDKCIAWGGEPNDLPVVGDWNGDGRTKIGIYRAGTWYLDANGNGAWDGCEVDKCIAWGGEPGDLPVLGDWNGDGKTKIGIVRNGVWYLDANGNGVWDSCGTDKCISWGDPSDTFVVGDWNGDGKTKIGIYRPSTGTWYLDANGNGAWDGCEVDKCIAWGGEPGDLPVLGDWNGDGKTKIGIVRGGTWYLDANGNGTWDGCGTDKCIAWGDSTDQFIVGRW